MSDESRSTIRLTAESSSSIETLERALALARDLEDLGFRVKLTGDVYIDARMEPHDVEPNP